MNVEELKAEAAKLPAPERLALAEWLAEDRDVSEARRERLRRDIQVGIDQIERGEYVECRDEEELHQFFQEIRKRAMSRLAARQQSAA